MYSKKNLRVGIFTAAILSSILLISGCSPAANEVNIGIDDKENQIELAVGQTLVITLKSNPTTGFRWEIAEIDEEILQQVGEPEYIPESDEPLVGQGGTEVFRFEAGVSGETQLKLVYHQPWDGGEQGEVFIIDVSVK